MKIVCWNLNHRLHCPSATAHVRRSKLKWMCLGSNPTASPTSLNFQKKTSWRPGQNVWSTATMERGAWVGSRVKGSARRGACWYEDKQKIQKIRTKKSSRYSTFLIIFYTDLAPFFVLVHRVGENICIN